MRPLRNAMLSRNHSTTVSIATALLSCGEPKRLVYQPHRSLLAETGQAAIPRSAVISPICEVERQAPSLLFVNSPE